MRRVRGELGFDSALDLWTWHSDAEMKAFTFALYCLRQAEHGGL